MKINEIFTPSEWKLLCRVMIQAADLDVDPVQYGDAIARRIYAKYANKPVNDMYKNYKEMEGDDAQMIIAADLALTYQESWQKILLALTKDYDPVENYDRYQYDERHINSDGSIDYGKRKRTDGEQKVTYGDKVSENDAYTDTHQQDVSAFNSASYSPDSQAQDIMAKRKLTDKQHEDTYGAKEISDDAYKDTNHNENEDTLDSHIHGNIGVTTNAQMIDGEISMRNRWRFVDIVVRDVVNEMTLKCY